MKWDLEWTTLDSKVLAYRNTQIRKIQQNLFDDPSPWLERTRWGYYLEGLDRLELLELIGEPNTPLLKVVWLAFDELARKSQETLLNIGIFARFEIVRTEKNQSRAKPFRAY